MNGNCLGSYKIGRKGGEWRKIYGSIKTITKSHKVSSWFSFL